MEGGDRFRERGAGPWLEWKPTQAISGGKDWMTLFFPFLFLLCQEGQEYSASTMSAVAVGRASGIIHLKQLDDGRIAGMQNVEYHSKCWTASYFDGILHVSSRDYWT